MISRVQTRPDDLITEVVSGIDVAPTIVSAVGAEKPDTWNGVILDSQEHSEREYVYSVTGPGSRLTQKNEGFPDSTLHASLRTDNIAFLWWSDKYRHVEFYDRATNHVDPTIHEILLDPDEIDNRDLYSELLTSRFAGVGSGEATDVAEHAEGIDERAAERLRELGYIE